MQSYENKNEIVNFFNRSPIGQLIMTGISAYAAQGMPRYTMQAIKQSDSIGDYTAVGFLAFSAAIATGLTLYYGKSFLDNIRRNRASRPPNNISADN